jgi:Icc-related predicted phosphoesterase
MKILHISDTHSYHDLLNIPKDIEMIIHSGDFSNYKSYYKNEPEARDFLRWYGNLDIKYKILIAGNHDAMPAINPSEFKSLCEYYNIIYLENSDVIIEGIKIWGSPHTPTFGDWYFMKSRGKLYDIWKHIPNDTDIVVVHGPPQKKLDLSYDRDGRLEYCGCKSLANHIENRIKPTLVCFGHIHSSQNCINAGVLYMDNIYYSNGSVVTDNKFGKLTSNGNIFEINNERNIKICQ